MHSGFQWNSTYVMWHEIYRKKEINNKKFSGITKIGQWALKIKSTSYYLIICILILEISVVFRTVKIENPTNGRQIHICIFLVLSWLGFILGRDYTDICSHICVSGESNWANYCQQNLLVTTTSTARIMLIFSHAFLPGFVSLFFSMTVSPSLCCTGQRQNKHWASDTPSPEGKKVKFSGNC